MNEHRRSSANENSLSDKPSNESVAAGVGALLGALFGAAIGSSLYGSVGGLIGAVIGAIIGGIIGRATVGPKTHVDTRAEGATYTGTQTVGTTPASTVASGEASRDTDASLARRTQDTSTSTANQSAWNRVDRSDTVKFPLSAEQLQIDQRELEAGLVRLRKVVKTEVVHVPVELRREEIIVERVEPGAKPSANEAATSEPIEYAANDELVIPLVKEEPVVQKKAIVFSEVHVHKVVRTETETVHETVRREDVVVDRKEDV